MFGNGLNPPPHFVLFLVFGFEVESHYLSQGGLKLMIILP